MDERTPIGCIARSMMESRHLCFHYVSLEGKESDRVVEAYEVQGDGDLAELFAVNLEDRNGEKVSTGLRRFRLSRMSDFSLGDEFKPTKPVKIPT